eukprot:GHVR01143320.1.p1 GENE.GHVR01143320.1~~GHVR01143320.1.p1  ORF type:complete len:559 (+),score=133.83 GHVR01143320.1:36-1712(+)
MKRVCQSNTTLGDALIGRMESRLFELTKVSRVSKKTLQRHLAFQQGIATEHKTEEGMDVIRQKRMYPLIECQLDSGTTSLVVFMNYLNNKNNIKENNKNNIKENNKNNIKENNNKKIKRIINCENNLTALEVVGYINFTKKGGFSLESEHFTYCNNHRSRVIAWLRSSLVYLQTSFEHNCAQLKSYAKEAERKNIHLAHLHTMHAASLGNLPLLDWMIRHQRKEHITTVVSPREAKASPNDTLSIEAVLTAVLCRFCPLLLDPKTANTGNSMLHLAAKEGDLQLVQTLLNFGDADVNATGTEMYTPLHYSLKYGHYNVSEYLVYNNARTDVAFFHKPTLEKYEKEGVVDIEGVDVPLTNDNLRSHPALREFLSKDGMTPMLMVCKAGVPPVSLFNAFIKKGADFNQQDDLGMTPLMLLCKRGLLEQVMCVCDNKDINKDININSQSTLTLRTPLHEACTSVDVENRIHIVKYLLNNKANPLIPDINGVTALDLVTKRRFITETLLINEYIDSYHNIYKKELIDNTNNTPTSTRTHDKEDDLLSDVSDSIFVEMYSDLG